MTTSAAATRRRAARAARSLASLTLLLVLLLISLSASLLAHDVAAAAAAPTLDDDSSLSSSHHTTPLSSSSSSAHHAPPFNTCVISLAYTHMQNTPIPSTTTQPPSTGADDSFLLRAPFYFALHNNSELFVTFVRVPTAHHLLDNNEPMRVFSSSTQGEWWTQVGGEGFSGSSRGSVQTLPSFPILSSTTDALSGLPFVLSYDPNFAASHGDHGGADNDNNNNNNNNNNNHAQSSAHGAVSLSSSRVVLFHSVNGTQWFSQYLDASIGTVNEGVAIAVDATQRIFFYDWRFELSSPANASPSNLAASSASIIARLTYTSVSMLMRAAEALTSHATVSPYPLPSTLSTTEVTLDGDLELTPRFGQLLLPYTNTTLGVSLLYVIGGVKLTQFERARYSFGIDTNSVYSDIHVLNVDDDETWVSLTSAAPWGALVRLTGQFSSAGLLTVVGYSLTAPCTPSSSPIQVWISFDGGVVFEQFVSASFPTLAVSRSFLPVSISMLLGHSEHPFIFVFWNSKSTSGKVADDDKVAQASSSAGLATGVSATPAVTVAGASRDIQSVPLMSATLSWDQYVLAEHVYRVSVPVTDVLSMSAAAQVLPPDSLGLSGWPPVLPVNRTAQPWTNQSSLCTPPTPSTPPSPGGGGSGAAFVWMHWLPYMIGGAAGVVILALLVAYGRSYWRRRAGKRTVRFSSLSDASALLVNSTSTMSSSSSLVSSSLSVHKPESVTALLTSSSFATSPDDVPMYSFADMEVLAAARNLLTAKRQAPPPAGRSSPAGFQALPEQLDAERVEQLLQLQQERVVDGEGAEQHVSQPMARRPRLGLSLFGLGHWRSTSPTSSSSSSTTSPSSTTSSSSSTATATGVAPPPRTSLYLVNSEQHSEQPSPVSSAFSPWSSTSSWWPWPRSVSHTSLAPPILDDGGSHDHQRSSGLHAGLLAHGHLVDTADGPRAAAARTASYVSSRAITPASLAPTSSSSSIESDDAGASETLAPYSCTMFPPSVESPTMAEVAVMIAKSVVPAAAQGRDSGAVSQAAAAVSSAEQQKLGRARARALLQAYVGQPAVVAPSAAVVASPTARATESEVAEHEVEDEEEEEQDEEEQDEGEEQDDEDAGEAYVDVLGSSSSSSMSMSSSSALSTASSTMSVFGSFESLPAGSLSLSPR